MTSEEPDDAVLEKADQAADAPVENESLDEENRLKSEFVRDVREALRDGDGDRVYELVEPLHTADIADLFELTDEDDRLPLARAIRDLPDRPGIRTAGDQWWPPPVPPRR